MTKLSRVAVLLALMGAYTASAAESISGNITVLNANTSSGTATSGSTVALDLAGGSMYDPVLYQYNTMAIQVTGTFTATLTFQSSFDGSTWVSHTVTTAPVTASIGTQVTTATAAGKWYANVSGIRKFRVTCTAYTSGTATVVLTTGSGAQLVAIQSMPPLPAGSAALGEVTAVGKAADGAAVSGNPVLIAGQDGTNAQSLSVDSTGRAVVVGAAATGAALSGNPVYVAGSDGTNAQALRVQASNSTAANGAVVLPAKYSASLPTLTDGNVAFPQLDVGGRLLVAGSVADDAAIAGNPVPIGVRVVASGSAPTALTAGDVAYPRANINGILHTMPWHPNLINCNVAVSTATTIQAVGGSCAAPGSGLSIYITDISFGSSAASSTAADAFPTLKSGTGGTCGSDTAVVWSSMGAANTTIKDNLTTPIKVTANNELCWIMTEAGSKVVRISGFIAP